MSEMDSFSKFPMASNLEKRKIEEEERFYALEQRCENAQPEDLEPQESSLKASGNSKKKKHVPRINPSVEMRKIPVGQKPQTVQDISEDTNTRKGCSLYTCSVKLLNRIAIINVGNKLYWYNGICYEAVDSLKLVSLYRQYVDNQLHGTRNMTVFSKDLYQYLLSDANLIRQPDYQNVERYVLLKNGAFDIVSQRLIPHTSRLVVFSSVDAKFTDDQRCPVFEKFLDEITDGDKLLKKRFWFFMAYILSQSIDAKAFFVMGCAPNSGKSVLGHFIQQLYDQKYVSHIALNDMHKEFSLAPLVGSAVNISLDLPASKLNDAAVSRLKQLTGDDSIVINEKYMPQFSYYNRAKFIFATNHPIKLIRDDEAFWNRLIYLPFTKSIEKREQNPDLKYQLMKEKNAIVSCALVYGRELWDNSFEFPSTPYIEQTIRQWRGLVKDDVDQFLRECCVLSGDVVETMDRLYQAYCVYSGTNKISRADFKCYLENETGLTHIKKRINSENPKSAFMGIRLKQVTDDCV